MQCPPTALTAGMTLRCWQQTGLPCTSPVCRLSWPAALCGQTGRFFTAFAGGQAVCDTQVNVTAEDTTVQLHLRDTDFQPLGAYNEDWQALLCTELQQAFSALTADDAADFFHLQFWHVNLCGPGSALPVPRLEILFE